MIPEISYDIEKVAEKINRRKAAGKRFSIVVVAEGAKPVGGSISIGRVVKDSFETIRLGGAGNKLADDLEKVTGL